jgi:hypothetical protein
MFYFEGILCPESIAHLFSSAFVEKLRNGQTGLNIKILKGFHKPGQPPLCSARINDNERVLFSWKIIDGKKKIILFDRLFHKEYDAKLKNKNALQDYLNSLGLRLDLNLDDLGQFDEQFTEFEDQNELKDLENLFKTDLLDSIMNDKLLASPVYWSPHHVDFQILDDAQEAVTFEENNLTFGPPGSGKTVVLGKLCKEMCRKINLLENASVETKVDYDTQLQCLYLTPNPELATHVIECLGRELPSNSTVRVLDYDSFARFIDPTLGQYPYPTQKGH